MSINALGQFWRKWEQTVLTFLAVIVVGVSSYLFGLTHSVQTSDSLTITPIQGTNTVLCSEQCNTLGIDHQGQGDFPVVKKDTYKTSEFDAIADNTQKQSLECLFVGSVNGSKYYPPDCKAINRIKKENLTCFSSESDAHEKGYSLTKSC